MELIQMHFILLNRQLFPQIQWNEERQAYPKLAVYSVYSVVFIQRW